MFFLEYETTEEEMLAFIQEATNDSSNDLREQLIDPVVNVLNNPSGREEYISYGAEFLEANSDMLAKEFPTKKVSFPKKYVDNVLKMFGFTLASLKSVVKNMVNQVNDKSEWLQIMATPTNVIHSIALFYSDMILHRQLRDSARQQLGLSVYNNVFNHFFYPPHPTEPIMAYTYMNLNNTWGLVRSENIINWIGDTTDTAYGFWRTKLSLNMSPNILVQFLNRVRTSFRQNMRLLANKYFENMELGNSVGNDTTDDDEYLESNNTTRYRINLIRKIQAGDSIYKNMNQYYNGIARLKNVKADQLYDFAQTVEDSDIGNIIDLIFHVFIVKEGNGIEDINSTKYISRITNFPTAIDRVISGKPVIVPMCKKYNADANIVKAYICFLATYIMNRISEINQK